MIFKRISKDFKIFKGGHVQDSVDFNRFDLQSN